MKDYTPKLCETYHFYINGKTLAFKFIGQKGNNYIFALNGRLTEMTPARFKYLIDTCNMQDVKEKQPDKPGIIARLFKRNKTGKRA